MMRRRKRLGPPWGDPIERERCALELLREQALDLGEEVILALPCPGGACGGVAAAAAWKPGDAPPETMCTSCLALLCLDQLVGLFDDRSEELLLEEAGGVRPG
jgi:hypothetical protein